METLGYNYRITDIQCALGMVQLSRLDEFIDKRNEVAKMYDAAFANIPEIQTLKKLDYCGRHARHLYVIKVENREELFDKLRSKQILVNVHYMPIYLHEYYRDKYQFSKGLCPNAESFYDRILSLPIFPTIKKEEVEEVIDKVIQGVSS